MHALFIASNSFIVVLWMVCIAYNFFNQAISEAWPFVVAEVVVGIVCPVVVFVGCILLAIVITFITAEQVDLRIIIQRMLPSVKLEIAKAPKTANGNCDETKEPAEYWVIADHHSIKSDVATRASCGMPRAETYPLGYWPPSLVLQ